MTVAVVVPAAVAVVVPAAVVAVVVPAVVAAVVPLAVGGNLFGVLNLEYMQGGPGDRDSDAPLLYQVANHAALAPFFAGHPAGSTARPGITGRKGQTRSGSRTSGGTCT